MVITLTINPSLDKTIEIENFAVNKINRAKNIPVVDPGGKGINVSKVLKKYGVDTKALGFAGGDTGKVLQERLEEMGIMYRFIETQESTRVNTKILDIKNNTLTDINELGAKISSENIKDLKELILQEGANCSFIVFSGSLAQGVPADIYKVIMESLPHDCKVLLDTSGQPLHYGVLGNPWFVKPNLEEFWELTGKQVEEPYLIAEEARWFLGNGIAHMAISLGEKGLMYVSETECLLATSPKVDVKSTVGAGDSVLAAFVIGFLRNQKIEDIVTFATAMGSAAVLEKSTVAPNPDIVAQLMSSIEVINL
ncbi:MAG: 1-phosphofructokinase [Defluviitaleaceae bacterium]|nr:1-phosphofructokinase [Defluviitaleaceae bacterium]